MSHAAVLALTMGEPAGIGGELTLMAWMARHACGVPPFLVIDDPSRLRALAHRLGLPVPVTAVDSARAAALTFGTALPVLPIPVPLPVEPGQPDPRNGHAVLASIDRAVALTLAGAAAAVVTNPIHKGVLYRAGFRHPGHTEYLGALVGVAAPVMMLEGGGLRVVPVTCHLSIRRALAALTTEGIVLAGRVTALALARDFGLAAPRLAVAGLNPHAGEDGALGSEEAAVIAPALAILAAEGLRVSGPHAADTLFHERARLRYDAALCMLHDQALIPLKTLAFDSGVNITLGLPIIRTSPDHGTAFDLAGSGSARPDSLIAALKTAARLAATRAGAMPPS
ncbi:MAG: 4-hydroxythreonine-4-phosphate dehydrogenase PdxA [Rhodospirillaceae bacterium]